MAVSVGDLALDLRLLAAPVADDDNPAAPAALAGADISILARLLATAEAMVTERSEGAPDALRDSAVIAIAAYMYDRPTTAGNTRFASAWTNSGASEILSAYIRRRALSIGSNTSALTGAGVPGVGVDRAAVLALIQDWAETGNAERLPAGKLPMPPSPAEARGGIATAIRSWTSQLVHTAINAALPAWARINDDTPIPAGKLVNAEGGGGVGGVNVSALQVRLSGDGSALKSEFEGPNDNTATQYGFSSWQRALNHSRPGAPQRSAKSVIQARPRRSL